MMDYTSIQNPEQYGGRCVAFNPETASVYFAHKFVNEATKYCKDNNIEGYVIHKFT